MLLLLGGYFFSTVAFEGTCSFSCAGFAPASAASLALSPAPAPVDPALPAAFARALALAFALTPALAFALAPALAPDPPKANLGGVFNERGKGLIRVLMTGILRLRFTHGALHLLKLRCKSRSPQRARILSGHKYITLLPASVPVEYLFLHDPF